MSQDGSCDDGTKMTANDLTRVGRPWGDRGAAEARAHLSSADFSRYLSNPIAGTGLALRQDLQR